MASVGIAKKQIPESETYDFPAIPYILNIQLASDDKKGLFIGFYNESQKIEGLLIVPPTKEEVEQNSINADAKSVQYSGCNLILQDNDILNSVTNERVHIDDTIIGVEKNTANIYLLSEKQMTPLWKLPQQIYKEFKLDGSISYGFSIDGQKPIMLKKIVSNFLGKASKNEAKEWVMITDSLEFQEKNKWEIQRYGDPRNTTFVYVAGESEVENQAIQESLDRSYFTKYNSKYYLKDCQISVRDGKFNLMSVMVSDTGEGPVSAKNTMTILANIPQF
tara:strand:+ start:515 stop:1345 length:831 start_codon:yes stop_codon:yes gene_type:complete